MFNAYVDSLGHDSSIVLQKQGQSANRSLDRDAVRLTVESMICLLLESMSYLLVDNNTYSSLGDIPHLAGAAMIHLVRHSLKQAGKRVSVKRHAHTGWDQSSAAEVLIMQRKRFWLPTFCTAELTLMST